MHKNKGFTLVELGISVVIISLIAAVITVASSLRREAAVRTIITEVDQIKVSVGQFYSIYNFYPGDFPYASTNWCSATCAGSSNNTANCVSDGGGTAGYCNGNGNGVVEHFTPNALLGDEILRFWQHMNLAGTYPGSFLGYHSFSQQNDIAGVTTITPNVPGSFSGITGLGYTAYDALPYVVGTVTPVISTTPVANITYTPVGIIAGGGVSSGVNNASVIPISTAYEIDLKLDDGIPATGRILSSDLILLVTTPNNCLAGSVYDVANNNVNGYGCYIFFVLY